MARKLREPMHEQNDTQSPPPSLARAGVRDTARILGGVLAPVVAEGVVARRKSTVRLGGRLDTHGRAARILNDLRTTYDADAVRLTFPRPMIVALRPPAVTATLMGTPDPTRSRRRRRRRSPRCHGSSRPGC